MRLAGIVTLGVVVLAAICGFYVWLYVLRDGGTRTDESKVLSEFRAQRHAAAELDPQIRGRVPEPGVYRYRTTGEEAFDALIASTHDLDGISTITLTITECGIREYWRVLEERWSKADLCLGRQGARLKRLTEFHEFFGQSRLTEYRCRERKVPFTRDLQVGMSWQTDCRTKESRVQTRARVEALEPVVVGGTRYPAVRISSRTTLTGDPSGTASRVSWLRRSDGLLLKRTSTSSAQVEDVGGGQVHEEFKLELISVTPRS